MLHQQRVFPLILENLRKYSGCLGSTIRLELSQLIVFTLRQTTFISSSLLDDFINYRGYEILTQNLISLGKIGTREEIANFIGLVCHLLFTSEKEINFSFQHYVATSHSGSSSNIKNAHAVEGQQRRKGQTVVKEGEMLIKRWKDDRGKLSKLATQIAHGQSN